MDVAWGCDDLCTGTPSPTEHPVPFPQSPLKAETNNLACDFSAGGFSVAEPLILFPCPAAEEILTFWCFSAQSVTLPFCSQQYENIWPTCGEHPTRCVPLGPMCSSFQWKHNYSLAVNVLLIKYQAKYHAGGVIAVESGVIYTDVANSNKVHSIWGYN